MPDLQQPQGAPVGQAAGQVAVGKRVRSESEGELVGSDGDFSRGRGSGSLSSEGAQSAGGLNPDAPRVALCDADDQYDLQNARRVPTGTRLPCANPASALRRAAMKELSGAAARVRGGGGASGSFLGSVPHATPWSFRNEWAHGSLPPLSRLITVSRRQAQKGQGHTQAHAEADGASTASAQAVTSVVWHPTGRYFAVARASGSVGVFTLADALNGAPRGGDRIVSARVGNAPPGVSGASDGVSFSATAHWVRPRGATGPIAWVPGSDSMLISGQQGGSLAVFDLGTGSLLSELSVAGGSVTSMAALHVGDAGNGGVNVGLNGGCFPMSGGGLVAVGTEGGVVSLLDLNKQDNDRGSGGHGTNCVTAEVRPPCGTRVIGLSFASNDGAMLSVGTADGVVHVYDVSAVLRDGSVHCGVGATHGGVRFVQSIEVDGSLQCVSYGRGERLAVLAAGAGARLCAVQSDTDGGSVGGAGGARIDWDAAHVQSWGAHAHEDPAAHLGFSVSDAGLAQGGALVACGSEDGQIMVYNEHWRDAVARALVSRRGVSDAAEAAALGEVPASLSGASDVASRLCNGDASAPVPPCGATGNANSEVCTALAWQPRGVSLGSPLLLSGGSCGTVSLLELQDMGDVAAYFQDFHRSRGDGTLRPIGRSSANRSCPSLLDQF